MTVQCVDPEMFATSSQCVVPVRNNTLGQSNKVNHTKVLKTVQGKIELGQMC